ncbi:alpha/beta hydrolase [Niabella sp. 22666]|uniref:alpha/beta hydrolase n=1 Tax=Niabella sp. 22666 TaxID=3453954 RepID=UPI003F84A8C8
MKFISTAILLVLCSCVIAQKKVTILLDSFPGVPVTDTLYVAGSFNGWQPGKSGYAFHNRSIVLSLPAGPAEFKITRGTWEREECSANGTAIQNRSFSVVNDTIVHLTIEGWRDQFASKPVVHTATPRVTIIDTAFYIPQLKRSRRIWLYLPEKYNNDTHQRYPVLYMQDGQNLFDAASGFAGEWGIDEFLDSTRLPECIVVGIDHGGDKRLTEYNPYNNERFGKGEGQLYLDFLVHQLKPFIDKNYRTFGDASHTFIAGSSMGGLISMYAAMTYPGIFGKAGVFSPAFWVAKADLQETLQLNTPSISPAIYFYAGGGESKEMITDMKDIARIIQQKFPKTIVKTVINPSGQHKESEWQKQFPGFYRWLMH